ncbi:ubiquitin carboxyl-terminal hydrolase CYLD isoform X1 [Bombina bombina]|uniref:ubiquitin carboxyl-terminal hydrolase CYLD isoform X1 n=1 Tax=Bombina bombina TaxID=8345 RepID=UPI00235AABEB|nr:ubiquitin carboxyl-terminal hydrolase CYLD isoform X1 [Bombina bombina]XP_053571404.1 ubiquitin carboxyl-terminal hydrolase CYLD isoform X1 [Bombina bombina]
MAQHTREIDDLLMYFILLESFPVGAHTVEAGRLCFMSEEAYVQHVASDHPSPHCLRVNVLGENNATEVDVNVLHPLSTNQAALLLAVKNSAERLNCFLERGLLEHALLAKVGQHVLAEHEQSIYPALIHFIGNISDNCILPPVYFGVELEGDGEGKGQNSGSHKDTAFFKCKKNSGLFLPFNKIIFTGPLPYSDVSASFAKTDVISPVKSGDKVAFYVENTLKRGLVMATSNPGSDSCVEVLMEDGPIDDVLKIPLVSVMKEEAPPSELHTDSVLHGKSPISHSTSNGEQKKEDIDQRHLEVNSMVQIQYNERDLVYGTIRWLGHLPEIEDLMAGVELEDGKGYTDGTLKNHQYFSCTPKQGIFVKLKACKPDPRFLPKMNSLPMSLDPSTNSLCVAASHKIMEKVPPLHGGAAVEMLKGRMKGIQGHCNSCYMDAALFSLFSCSSVLDSLLFKPSSITDGHIQRILREEIVNPLRRIGYVPASSVMMLRQQLKQESQCDSFTTSEKDPEEFLNLIVHRILGMEPLLKLCSKDQSVQASYCYQIFIEKQQTLTIPNVQQLLEHSFHHSNLKLAEVPSCFIIQMPRFGKDYKMFSKIIPSLELDITDLLQDSPRECVVCGALATKECSECFKDKVLSESGLKHYCDVCAKQVL